MNRRIYIAGPLLYGQTADINIGYENLKKTMESARELMKKNWAPYIPHLSIHMYEYFKNKGDNIPWETWMALDYNYLNVCDALFYMGSSKGADAELYYAIKKGKTIYLNLSSVPDLSKEDISELVN